MMVDFCGRWLESTGYCSRLMEYPESESGGRLLYGAACLLEPSLTQHQTQQQAQQQAQEQSQQQIQQQTQHQTQQPPQQQLTAGWPAVSQQPWPPALSQLSARADTSRTDTWLAGDTATRADTEPPPGTAAALTPAPAAASYWPTEGEWDVEPGEDSVPCQSLLGDVAVLSSPPDCF